MNWFGKKWFRISFLGLFSLVLVWAIATTTFWLYRSPLPVPDRGHRCFAVADENSAKVVASILVDSGLPPERFTFDAGTTHQTLLWDNSTVIIWHDKEEKNPNGLSIAVSNPKETAQKAVNTLLKNGFTSTVKNDLLPPEAGENMLSIVESNAFKGWVLVFRRHVLSMGEPPNQRTITK